MPHDKHGRLLSVGSLVTLTAVIIALQENVEACNCTIEAVDEMPGTGYKPQVTLNTKQVELVSPEYSQPDTGSAQSGDSASDRNIRESKSIRKQIDEVIQNLRKAQLNHNGRERSLSLTKLQEAVMWLGMDLKALNPNGNPYPSSYDPSTTTVEPVADGLKL